MKKFTLTLLGAIFVMSVTAQINKGAVLINATTNLNFTSLNPDEGSGTETFTLKGSVGYFVAENLALGPVFSYEKQEDYSTSGIGVFGRYYVNGKVFFGAGYTSNRIKFDLGSLGDFKLSYNVIPLEVGYAAFITPSISIEPSVAYSIYSGDQEGSSLGINVGFGIYLNRDE